MDSLTPQIEGQKPKQPRQEKNYSPFQQAWKRLKRNKTAMGGLVYIIISLIIAILGYLIIPDKTPFANDMILELGTKKPGFSIDVLRVRKNRQTTQVNVIKKMFYGQRTPYDIVPMLDYEFWDDKIVVQEYVGEGDEAFEVVYNVADVAYPILLDSANIAYRNDSLYFYNYEGFLQIAALEDVRTHIEKNLVSTKRYLLGSDKFGRDILSRLIIGVRISLSVGFVVVLISLVIGISIGAVGGYFRGKVDDLIMWLINVVWSIPALLLIFSLTLVLGQSFWMIFLAIGLTMWVEVARIIRGQVIGVRELDFIEASRALGYGNFRIITRHILPNVMGPVIVIAAANFATAILVEAGLSFLGIGVQPPVPSWGMMINEHQDYLITQKPFLAIVPGVAIMMMVLAFYLLGNGLRDAFDVQAD